jgi:two-component sensor histidine kinase
VVDATEQLRDPARLNALRRTGLVDSPPEEAFDRLTRLARKAMGVPAAVVTLVTGNRQFFKSCVGLPEPWQTWRQTPLSHSFCQFVIRRGEPLLISDAREVDYLRENRAIVELGVVAYAGLPLTTPEGVVIGTVAAADGKPRNWTPAELESLRDLAGCAASEVALREAGRHYRSAAEQNERLAQELEHRVGNNLAALAGLVSVLEGRATDVPSFAAAVRERLAGIVHVHRLLGRAGVSGIGLATLVRSLKEAMEPTAPFRVPVTVSGPEVVLDPKRVLPLAMVLVEWFSNSAKYGAHSAAGGRVEVSWEVVGASGGAPCVVLRWRERGGPRIDGERAGSLGTMLVEGFATRDLSGTLRLAYPAEGASHEIEFPVGEEGVGKCGR